MATPISLNSAYDAKAPIKLSVAEGSLVRAEISDASNDYLRSTATLAKSVSDFTLSPVIMEPEEWLNVKALVLHDAKSQPKISVSGKVAGQQSIAIIQAETDPSDVGFWHELIAGGIWIQIARLPIYSFAFALCMMIVSLPLAIIPDEVKVYKRRKLVKKFKARTRVRLSDEDEVIFKWYIDCGSTYLQQLITAAMNPEELQARALKYLEFKRLEEDPKSEKSRDEDDNYMIDGRYPPRNRSQTEKMIEKGFIEEYEGTWRPSPDRLKTANALLDYTDMMKA